MEDMAISFSEFLQRVAGRAGLKIMQREPTGVTLAFGFEDGRSQKVWVRAVGHDGAGNLIIGFFSPVLQLPAGVMLGQKAANELLRENAQLAHGAWAIHQVEQGEFLVAFDTQIAQTIDPEEFEATVRGLAAMADSKEQEMEKDDY
jgi:hypothetical protein